MARSTATRAGLLLALALSMHACADDDEAPIIAVDGGRADAGAAPGPDGGGTVDIDAASSDAGSNPSVLKACLDAPPTALVRPPEGKLGCELLPPGLSL